MLTSLLNTMVLVIDGNSNHVVLAWRKMGLFGEKKIRYVTIFDLIKCLKPIKLQGLLLGFPPISGLPCTMINWMKRYSFPIERSPMVDRDMAENAPPPSPPIQLRSILPQFDYD